MDLVLNMFENHGIRNVYIKSELYTAKKEKNGIQYIHRTCCVVGIKKSTSIISDLKVIKVCEQSILFIFCVQCLTEL